MNLIDMIFIVDDDPIHQQIAKIMIERQGISSNIRVFSDAQEVLDYFRENTNVAAALPDLILLDLNMPVMDGWEFLDEYATFQAELPKSIKIFVLTSSIDEKDKERVRSYAFVSGYLTKPLSKEIISHLS
ncbi:Response regulator receiver domain-containing protein [Chitinophaga jiangningensis]|uniref:Response regulator receiver domain-containing protein n=1 Tax=Chitinophaga jiangningensis TaxID=1419482 RepID=A0A1M7KWE1_9BACT|nr:response regulator [Chitinophaga jiangningensis]SHM69804.1 Response regulator receiver domain-containing protein [Chitinophaga jiangningensis]